MSCLACKESMTALPVVQSQQPYLFSNHLRHAGVAMPQCIDGNSSRKVQVFPVLNIPHIAALALLKHWWWADIGRDHVWELLVDKTSRLRRGGWIGCR